MQGQGSIGQTSAWIMGIVLSGGLFGGAYGLLKTYPEKSSKSAHASHGKDGKDGVHGDPEHAEQVADPSSVAGDKDDTKENLSLSHGTKDAHKKGESQAGEGKHGPEGGPESGLSASPDGRVHEAEIAQKDKAQKDNQTQGKTDKSKREVRWAYEGRLGPKYWGKMADDFVTCEKGTKQSPLDLVDAESDARLQPIEFHYEAQDIAFENDGHTLMAKYPDSGNYIRHGDDKYNLVDFHLHAPSEHFVDGAPYDLEMHLVHRNASGKFLIVGVLMEALGKGSAVLEPLWKDLPVTVGSRGPTVKFNAESLLPKKREYWSYDGSLTTPPCSEGVKWYVMSNPMQISVRQVDQFQAAYRKNSRPPQSLSGRKILKTRSF